MTDEQLGKIITSFEAFLQDGGDSCPSGAGYELVIECLHAIEGPFLSWEEKMNNLAKTRRGWGLE